MGTGNHSQLADYRLSFFRCFLSARAGKVPGKVFGELIFGGCVWSEGCGTGREVRRPGEATLPLVGALSGAGLEEREAGGSGAAANRPIGTAYGHCPYLPILSNSSEG